MLPPFVWMDVMTWTWLMDYGEPNGESDQKKEKKATLRLTSIFCLDISKALSDAGCHVSNYSAEKPT